MNDLAQAHILAMEYLRKGNESNIFNLGNGVGFTVKEVVEIRFRQRKNLDEQEILQH